MPDGYGNAIFQLQIWAGTLSLLCVVGGVAFIVDEKRPNRKFGIRSVAIGAAVFVGATIAGYALELHLGLSDGHAFEVRHAAKHFLEARPRVAAFDACMERVWSPSIVRCDLWFDITAIDGHDRAKLVLTHTDCGHAPPAAKKCLAGLAFEVSITAGQHASLAYGGTQNFKVDEVVLGGNIGTTPAEAN